MRVVADAVPGSYLGGSAITGNVLQQKEPCPHTNTVEHSVGQASSRKLQA